MTYGCSKTWDMPMRWRLFFSIFNDKRAKILLTNGVLPQEASFILFGYLGVNGCLLISEAANQRAQKALIICVALFFGLNTIAAPKVHRGQKWKRGGGREEEDPVYMQPKPSSVYSRGQSTINVNPWLNDKRLSKLLTECNLNIGKKKNNLSVENQRTKILKVFLGL